MNLKILKHKPVKCKFWSPKKTKGCFMCQGSCRINLAPDPSIDGCNDHCGWNTSKPNHKKAAFVMYEYAIPFFVTNFFEKLKSYFRAEYSYITQGAVSSKVYKQRIDACLACEYLVKTEDEIGHCSRCGCSMKAKRAGLTVKGRMPMATCPINKWN